MGCIQAYFRKAQSGLSPSSTLEQEPPEVITEENVSGRVSEKISYSAVSVDDEPTEDEDPDKSQGVRATAVLSLAASTGTVAILGTTAQPLPTDISETTLNTVQNLEIEDSYINHLTSSEKHIPLKDSIDLEDKPQKEEEKEKEEVIAKLIEYTEEPKRIFSDKVSSELTQREISSKIDRVPELTVTSESSDNVNVDESDVTDEPRSEAQDESSATDAVNLLAEDQDQGEMSEETKSESSPLVVQILELEKSSSPSTADSDVTMQKESDTHKTEKDVSDTSISMDETSDVTRTHTGFTNEYNLIENEDSSESVETYSLGTKLQFNEVVKPDAKTGVTEAINQRLSSLVREVSEDEMPTTVLELTKNVEDVLDNITIESPKTLVFSEHTKESIVNGVDVWREDNNVNKFSKLNADEDVNSIIESNEYVERVKLKAEDFVNEICAKAESVNQNGFNIKEEPIVVSSVNFSKANSVDSYSRPILAETKMKTSMTSSFEDALLNVNFGEGAEVPKDEFYPRLSTIGSELELASNKSIDKADDLSPLDKSGSSFSDTDLSLDEVARKELSDSVIETIRVEIEEICDQAVDKATQLLNEKLAEREQESDSNEISENGTSTNNPSMSFSDDTQILESSNNTVVPADEKLVTAATTIQASFRGYQVRKAKQSKLDLPATESTVVEDDDLPPPDMDLLGSEDDTISEEDLPQPPEFDDLPLPEDLAELDEYVVTPEIRDQMVRRNTIIEQARLSASMNESSSDFDSSMSSAATKIQAGIRGFLTRKHLKNTSSTTAPSMDDSDLSTGEANQLKKALSVEETEIQRHPFSPEDKYTGGKRMSLDSSMKEKRERPPMRSTMSECVDDRVWMGGSEEEAAAARIQSGYRNYRSRQKLKRGDAMQMPTTSSSVTPASATPVSAVSEEAKETPKHTGEYHDILALSPPHILKVLEEEPDMEEDSEKAADKKSNESQLVDAAIKIQSVFRGYKTRKELNEGDSRTETESLESTQTEPLTGEAEAPGEESKTEVDVDELNATKIQAAVRGYLTRKQLGEKRDAAVKIQDNFRRYSARKKAKNQK